MTTETILLLVIILLLAGTFPSWPHSKSWGYAPSGILTLVLVIFLIWVFADGRPLFKGSKGNVQTSIEDAGQDLKRTGRDVADSIRRTVQ